VVAALCQNYRHAARWLIAGGPIGDVFAVHGSYLQDWLCNPAVENWRLQTDTAGRSIAFADMGTHWCDLACHLLDTEISSITARNGSLYNCPGDDHAGALLAFDHGAFGVLTISQVSPGEKTRLRICVDGTGGSISWDQERPDELRLGHANEPNREIRKDPAALPGPVARLSHLPPGHPEGWNTSFKNHFLAVYRTILGSADAAFATLADGHERVRLIEAFVASSESGQTIALCDPATKPKAVQR
jgi:predicted dehydrogenase